MIDAFQTPMISIICPFYNEKPNLKVLFERLQASLQNLHESWEMIFVDDGSVDDGGEYLENLIAAQPAMRLVQLKKNSGLTAAFWAGFEESRGEVLVTLDSDLQNPPEEIPRLVDLIQKSGADIVTGVRQVRCDGWLKKLSSKIAHQIRRSVTKDTMKDVGCSLRIFKRETLSAFLPYKGMHRFFLVIAEAEGFKIEQVPVAHAPRAGGRSKYGFWNRLGGPLTDLFVVKWLLFRKVRYQTRSKKL